jgi:hypothetical protein
MISFVCARCSSKFKVDVRFAGKKTKCPTCGKELVVPISQMPHTAQLPTAHPDAGDGKGNTSNWDEDDVCQMLGTPHKTPESGLLSSNADNSSTTTAERREENRDTVRSDESTYALSATPPVDNPTISRNSASCICPACGGDIETEWTSCPTCNLLLTQGICSACGGGTEFCRCGLRPVVRVRKTKQSVCMNCGRTLPFEPPRCPRCAMDFYTLYNPFTVLYRENLCELATRPDKQRLRSFRSVLDDVNREISEKRNQQFRQTIGAMAGAVVVGALVGSSRFGAAWGAHQAGQSGSSGSGNELECLRAHLLGILAEFHKQTNHKHATFHEKYFNFFSRWLYDSKPPSRESILRFFMWLGVFFIVLFASLWLLVIFAN